MAEDNESKLPAQSAPHLALSSSLSASERQCHRCKELNAQDAKYCTKCGNWLSERQCDRCKELNTQDAEYCMQCGYRLKTLYDKYGPRAEKTKIRLQMSVGVILTALIIVYFAIYTYNLAFTKIFQLSLLQLPLPDGSPLTIVITIVGVALAFSTAFELAYTLFTDGPDEAVNPVITGVAAAILLLISPTLSFNNAGAITLLTLALVVLFILKEFFIDHKGWIDRLEGKLPSEPTSNDNKTKDTPSTPSPRRFWSLFRSPGKL